MYCILHFYLPLREGVYRASVCEELMDGRRKSMASEEGGDDCILDTRLQMENQSVSFQIASILCMNVNHCRDLTFPWSGSKSAEMGKGLSRDLGCSCPLAPSLGVILGVHLSFSHEQTVFQLSRFLLTCNVSSVPYHFSFTF